MLPFLPKPNPHDIAANLHLAVKRSQPDEVARLLRQRADPHLMTTPEWGTYTGNAYHAFAATRHDDFLDKDRAVLDLLKRQRVNINATNLHGDTPLHLAAMAPDKKVGAAQIMAALLQRGADLLAVNRSGWNALHLLCRDNTSDSGVVVACVETLIKARAPLDARGAGGVSALMCAARAGLDDVCALLAHSDANIHLRDHAGLRASDYARVGGHHMLADQLLAREQREPETKASFDSTVVPKVQWDKLGDDRIARTTVEDPIRYQLTEIFNFHSKTYTCISKNLYTKAEAVTVVPFAAFADRELIDLARRVLVERKGGRVDDTQAQLRPRPIHKSGPK